LNVIANLIILVYIRNSLDKINEVLNRQQEQFFRLVSTIDEKFSNLMNIYLNDTIQESVQDYLDIDYTYTEGSKKNNKDIQVSIFTVRSIMYTYAAIAVLIMYWQLLKGEISQSDIVTTVVIIFFYCSAIDNLADRTVTTSKEITTIFASEALFTKQKQHNRLPLSSISGEIECKQLHFQYKSTNPILNDCNFHLKAGEKVALLGQTGCGKSTLVKLILGFYPIQEGTIVFDGRDISTIDLKDLRKQVHYINQKTNLFHDTIMNNIRYGNDISQEQVLSMLRKYDLVKVFGTEEDLTRMVEKHGSNISAGMQKVIIVIRGIFHQCKVLMMDEPFTSIDTDTRSKILQIIKNETPGKTLLIITHDMNGLEEVMDRCVHMKELNHIV
jgi:ATP-binding cassette subfamily B protein